MDFPNFNFKALGTGKIYDLNSPEGRQLYFRDKLGAEKIEALKEYLDHNTFVGFLVAKKGAGKGTFSKNFAEIVGPSRISHISVGDVVREVHKAISDPTEREALRQYLSANYRGFMSLDEALAAFEGYSQSNLIPTEFILAIVKREIAKKGRTAVFIDGFPRSLDQISMSLYFRDLINFRDDPDFFVIFNVANSIIDARLKNRVVCPLCHTPRNPKVNPTKFAGFDQATKEFYLRCDNKDCAGFGKERMRPKPGDEVGIEAIKDRLEMDGQLIEKVASLQGIDKVYLNNVVPLDKADSLVENYEVTNETHYEIDNQGQVVMTERPWIIKDDAGHDSLSLLPAATALSLASQIYDLLIK